jgi:hypothetical protein
MLFKTRLGEVTLSVASRFCQENKTVLCAAGTAAYARIIPPGRARDIAVKFTARGVKTSTVFLVTGGVEKTIQEMRSEMGFFNVPITWDEETPKVRLNSGEIGKDNWDIVIMLPDGHFVDIECSLITRHGKFFLGAQRVYEGQTVRTRENHKFVRTFTPLRAIHAYPGSSFRSVWSTLADLVLARAEAAGANIRKSTAFRPKWNPPAIPEMNGGKWQGGIVRYFNLQKGVGEIEDKQGVKYFVHFNNILAGDGETQVPEVPMLTGMSVVQFRAGDHKEGHARPSIKSLRPIRPVLVEEPRM